MAVQDYKINYKSDFVLTINGDAGWAVPFCIKFWTGMPSQAYFVGFDGVKYVNCRVGDTPTQLLVMFDDHHLPIGKLMMQIAYHTTIAEFPGSVFDEVTNARDVIVTIDGTDYQVMLDFTGEDAPELEFDLPAYANEAERIQNELQRQQNEADRIAAELQREQATAAAVQGAENVNAQLNGTTLTVTNRQGVSTSVNTKGEQGAQGPVGPEGPQGEQGETGISIVSFTPKSETSTTLIYTVTFSDGNTQDVPIPKGAKGDTGATGPQGPQGDTGVSITGFVETGETETDTIYNITFSNGTTQQVSIPKGEKGDTGEQGPVGPQGPQGPMGDVAVITPEQQAAFTMYSTTGQNTDGPMTQKAVTDVLVADAISYNNSQSGLAAENVQEALDEVAEENMLFEDTGYNPLGKSMANAYVASKNWINVTLDNHSITLTTANKQTSAYTQGPVCTILKNGKTYRIEFDYETDFNTDIRTVDTSTVNNVVLKSLSGSGHAIITHTMTYDSGGFTFLIPANTVVGKTISITNFFIYEVSNVKDVLTEVVKENSAFNSDLDSLLFPISEPSVLSFTELGYYINTNTWQWVTRSSGTYSKCIKVDPSSRYKITAETGKKCQIIQLINTTASNGGTPNFAGGGKNGVTIAAGGNIIIDTFSDCEYLYFMMSAYLGFSTPSEVVKREADAEVLLEGEKSLSIVSNRTKPCELAQVGAYGMYINTNTYVWANNANNTSCYVYKVICGTSVKISTNSTTRVQYTFLTKINAVAGNLADFADGWNKRIAAMVVDDTVTVDVPNNAKYIYMLSLPPTWGAPKCIDGVVGDGINAVDFVGDSLTATGLSLTSPMAYFPSKVREYIGIDGFNMGVGGENVGTILGRCNGIPYKLASDVTIPADTTQVQIYLTNIYGQHLLPLLQRYTSHTVVIDGIEGTLTTTQTNPAATTANYFFQRKESGSAYNAKAGDDIFVKDFKATFNPNRAKIIWVGQNGGFDTNSTSRYGGSVNNADDRARLIDMIKTYIDVSGCEYYMVLSAPQNTNNDLETDFTKAFGNRYFNVRMYMVNHGIDDAIALGYLSASSYPTQQDITDMNNGVVPSSLRIDNVHFTQNGFYTLAYALSTKLKEVWNL